MVVLLPPMTSHVYLLLVQSHLRKSCLLACMEEWMRATVLSGTKVRLSIIWLELPSEGANATLHHYCITPLHTCVLHRARSSPSAHSSAWAPTPQIDSVSRAGAYIDCTHFFTARTQSPPSPCACRILHCALKPYRGALAMPRAPPPATVSSLLTDVLPSSTRPDLVISASRAVFARSPSVVRTSLTAMYRQVWWYTNSPSFPRLCILASEGKLARLLQEGIPPSDIVVGLDLACGVLMLHSFSL
ncbi:hypothetical protein EDB84DRAFT_979996 [Lactarius hengduanensis]|nr:hypothetical protein EDB84DRAFT_979996 [Lactarius hengduanensis]